MQSAPKPTPSPRSSQSDVTSALALLLAFLSSLTLNALATRSPSPLVLFSNSLLAHTHPVYSLPSGYAFAVWGLIYALEALFVVYQLIPAAGLHAPAARAVRAPAACAFVANGVWLLLFGNERYWPALLVIVLYTWMLFEVVQRLDAIFRKDKVGLLTKLVIGAGFSANASWVTVASVLQIQVNLLEEGWLPSADFSIGLLLVAVMVAAISTFSRADAIFALVAAWALGGIINNQSPDSTWGCAAQICPACQNATSLSICSRPSSAPSHGLPNGWGGLECAPYTSNKPAPSDPGCVVPKSDAVIGWCYAGIAVVALALVAGFAHKAARSRRAAMDNVTRSSLLEDERPPTGSNARP